MGLNLSAVDIAALETRTEGWIAGLQLAALSMQGREDAPGFIRAFAGDDQYIVDYLVEEVLQRQPERVRRFLLQTSILDRLSGPLCNAVTGQGDGRTVLGDLERDNLFVVPLDDKRHWFRYHHLFADVLQMRAMEEQSDQIVNWHRRASEWYELNSMPPEAIRHALAAEDLERAAALVELAVPAMRLSRQHTTVLGWLEALPDAEIHRRPVLSVGYAWVLLASGKLEAVETRLRDAERWLDTSADTSDPPDAPAAEMVVVDNEEYRHLPGTIAVFRAGLAQVLGDTPATIKHARRALDLVSEDDHLLRGAAMALLGLASWASGDLEAAQRNYAAGMARVQRAGHLSDVSSRALILADISVAQGRLREAERTLEQAEQRATEQGEPVLRGTADLLVGLSELRRERNDLNAATQRLLRSKELGERTGLPQDQSRWCAAMARILETQGDFDGAIDLLQEAERLYVRGYSPVVRPLAALKTRIWVYQGRLDEALDWAREQELSANGELSYLREFEHITLARVLLAQYNHDRDANSIEHTTALLERLLKAAEAGKRTGSVIEILVQQALVHQARGDVSGALVPLKRALLLAEPEDYVRNFADEGPSMAVLLEESVKQGIATNYVRQILTAIGEAGIRTPAKQDMIEPLSERELDVLRLLGTDLDGPEIARELMVSLNTMRTHTKNIYSKLGVNSRRAAVHRALELGLLPRTGEHHPRPGGVHGE
jgi:LuxR family transcriptional regulator, maltose regulon positive regulatory protein